MARKDKPSRQRPGQNPPFEHARRPVVAPDPKVSISFEYYEAGGKYCLCRCERENVIIFLACLRKISERTWQQIIAGSSKDRASKTGLNCTPYKKRWCPTMIEKRDE